MKELCFIALQNKSDKYIFLVPNSPFKENWTNIWNLKKKWTKKVKATKNILQKDFNIKTYKRKASKKTVKVNQQDQARSTNI